LLVSEIDFNKVPHKTIRTFLKSVGINHIGELSPACYSENSELFSYHSKQYIVPAGIDIVWNFYQNLPPTECWDSDMISFGMLYSRLEDTVSYRDSQFDCLKSGQLYFINLKILGSFFSIPVVHEIIRVDDDEHVIQSCYLKSGKSDGSQWIRLFKIDENTTKVVHETRYKCDSRFREKYLYPYFHTKAIDQFHGNVIKAASK
jgi:hypothetical protein